ncbi:MAG: hypothetical protein ABSE06_13775 [Anaerolineaceae bacterium]
MNGDSVIVWGPYGVVVQPVIGFGVCIACEFVRRRGWRTRLGVGRRRLGGQQGLGGLNELLAQAGYRQGALLHAQQHPADHRRRGQPDQRGPRG